MTTKTNLKSGGWSTNHNETLVRAMPKTNITSGRKFLKVKTHVRAGTREYPQESIVFVSQRM